MAEIKAITAACAALALVSCAGDNPDNVPLHGDWEMNTRLGSLTIDGIVVPPEVMPPELQAMEGSEKRCGEPMFIDQQWQQSDITRQVSGGDCTLEEYDVTPTRITGKGICTGVAGDFNPRFTLDITQAEDRYRMKLSMFGDANIPGLPGRHVIRVTALQDGDRKGDC